MNAKIIFVTGGVLSSLGKGVASSSIGALLEGKGYKVKIRKLEPYINVDPGTMSPFQHGEVYVTDDGTESDLDLGHYERFTNNQSNTHDAISMGRIYSQVIAKERKGEYLGKTVQVIPHITNEIIHSITNHLNDDIDFLICEVGGTVGDIEGLPFVEAIRQIMHKNKNSLLIHLTLIPYVKTSQELKTKPTQHSVKVLQSMGIQPNILLCRTEEKLNEEIKDKISLFCNIETKNIIQAIDAKSIYEVPLEFAKEKLDHRICEYFNLPKIQVNLGNWKKISTNLQNPKGSINLAIVGKYVSLHDAYKSLVEAIVHAGIYNNILIKIHWISTDDIKNSESMHNKLANMQAIIVPGGYGERGIDHKIATIKHAREKNIPFLGICLGMQLALIEFARNKLKIKNAHSTEFTQECTPVVNIINKDSDNNGDLGGTMRLGARTCNLETPSLAHKIYQSEQIRERHRHRYAISNQHMQLFNNSDLKFSGFSDNKKIIEIIEIKNHKWFLGVQFHPEFKSTPMNPHAIFCDLIKTAYVSK